MFAEKWISEAILKGWTSLAPDNQNKQLFAT